MVTTELDERSIDLRRLVSRALSGGGREHVGPSLSLIELLRVLRRLPAFPPRNRDGHRDRLILSKGDGCLALYALLADKGFFPAEALDTFCREHSMPWVAILSVG